MLSRSQEILVLLAAQSHDLRRHRQKIVAQISPLSNFCKSFQRAINYSWQEFFWMHKHEDVRGVIEDELQADLQWAQQRKGSLAFEKAPLQVFDPAVDPTWDELCEKLQTGGPFYRALTKYELENALEYAWKFPRQAWQLNQNATEHAQCSNRQYLHTLIRSCGLIFTEHDSVQPPRWLSPTEMPLDRQELVAVDFN